MKPLVLAAAATLLVAACASPFGPTGDDLGPEGRVAELVPGKARISSGEPAPVVLRNHSPNEVGYGACEPRLERQTRAGWVLIGPEAITCIAMMYVLPPHAREELSLETAGLQAGTYRFRMAVYPKTSLPTQLIHSPSFEIHP